MSKWFDNFARKLAGLMGKPAAFAFAVLIVLVWAAAGPLFHWSNTHQLVINTSTTIITFLMVFIIQNTQNRDNLALHIKLDALIEQSKASNSLERLEEKSEREIKRKRKNGG